MKQILTQITNGEVLTREQTRQFIHGVVDGQYNDVQVSALLTGLIMRGIKVNELLGLRDGLIETGNPVDFSPYRVMDIVGTGGDHKNTFNISTCACLVVAGAGYKVAKHGNYAATSTSGAKFFANCCIARSFVFAVTVTCVSFSSENITSFPNISITSVIIGFTILNFTRTFSLEYIYTCSFIYSARSRF